MKCVLRNIFFVGLLLTILCGIMACTSKKTSVSKPNLALSTLPDTLRVGTLYSPTTYFIYRDEPMGYEYDMVRQYAASAGMEIELSIAGNFAALVEMLRNGEVDLLACRVPMTSDYKKLLRYCGPVNISTQVLVQRKSSSKAFVKDVTDLIGREVYVEENTKYQKRICNLNDEVGGGINIKVLNRDTLVTRDLVEMVAEGEVPLTVVDGDIAMLEQTYYSNIDVSIPVSMEQKSAWAVATDNKALAESIDNWNASATDNKAVQEIHRRYFELQKSIDKINTILNVGNNSEGYSSSGPAKSSMQSATVISDYDDIFRRYADIIGCDWRLLAAIAWEESRFNPNATSWAGAAGLMQIMPRTASRNGLSSAQIRNPERNIATGSKIFKALDNMFRKKVPDKEERLKFVLAAYNAGQGHIFDAISLADKHGMNPTIWNDNVRDALLMKARAEFYSDPVVKHGYFHGKETVTYVDKVFATYNHYKAHAPA